MTHFACIRLTSAAPEGSLLALAQDFSPRVELVRSEAAIVDVSGLGRLIGETPAIGAAICRTADERGVPVKVAIAATRTAALLLAIGARDRLTVVEPGEERTRLAPLPLRVLADLAGIESATPSPARAHPAPRRRQAGGGGRHYRLAPGPEHPVPARTETGETAVGRRGRTNDGVVPDAVLADLLQTVSRWGLSTLGELAAIPTIDLFERLGTAGVAWQAVARGCDARPLVRTRVEDPYEASLTLEWPIDSLEPLSFVLGRLLDPLCVRLDRAGTGAAAIQVTLQLVSRELHVRTLPLPVPMREARVLRTLALLDLESHPPPAAIDRVTVTLEAVPGRIVQYALLTRALPVPEQMATLTARLAAVMGEGHVGTPVLLDSHRSGAFDLQPFTATDKSDTFEQSTATDKSDKIGQSQATDKSDKIGQCQTGNVPAAVRRFRYPVPAQVITKRGRPVRIAVTHPTIRGGTIVQAAGPWRSSGEWWAADKSDKFGPGPKLTDQSIPVSDLVRSIRGSIRGSVRSPSPGSFRGCGADRVRLVPGWDCDEWDIVLRSGVVLCLSRDRTSGGWSVDAMVD